MREQSVVAKRDRLSEDVHAHEANNHRGPREKGGYENRKCERMHRNNRNEVAEKHLPGFSTGGTLEGDSFVCQESAFGARRSVR